MPALVRLTPFAVLTVLVSAALAPTSASAATCAATGSTVTVSSTTSETITLARVNDAIAVNGIACPGAALGAIVSIAVEEATDTIADQTLVIDLEGGPFGAGIDISVDLGGGSNSLAVKGGNAAETFRWGTAGLDLTGDGQPDVTIANADGLVDRSLEGFGGDDLLIGQGGLGTGSHSRPQ